MPVDLVVGGVLVVVVLVALGGFASAWQAGRRNAVRVSRMMRRRWEGVCMVLGRVQVGEY